MSKYISKAEQTKYPYKCKKCNIDFEVGYKAHRSYVNGKKEPYCRKCTFERLHQSNSDKFKNMTDEERKIDADRRRQSYYNMSSEAKEQHRQRSSDRWTEEEKEKHSKVVKNWWNDLSEDKYREILDKHKEYQSSLSDEELKLRSIRGKERWENLSDEEKLRHSQIRKDYWNNLSEEEKINHGRLTSDYWNNLSEEGKMELIAKKRKYWDCMSAEERSFEFRNRFYNLSDDDKKRIIEARKDGLERYWDNISDDELERKRKTAIENITQFNKSITNDHRQLLSKNALNRFESLSDEDQTKFMDRIWTGHKKWRESLTEEEQNKRIKDLLLKRKEWYDNLSDDELLELRRSQTTASQGSNKFHQKFEEYFKASYISNEYYIKPEETTCNNNVVHSWDYGIFNKNNNLLTMVIDLDGKFFHADGYDYNGIHSREEYDEKRFLSIPDGIKYHIIYELKFSKSFEDMIKLLMIDYNEFIERQFKICRLIPFPYPKYNDTELFNSYKQLINLDCESKYITLSTNTRIGDRLINHFHESIYSAKSKDSKLSPYEAWRDDDLLHKVIANRIIYINTLNPNKILQGFNIAGVAKKVSVFSAGRAKLLIHKYLNEYDTIFDPFSGFSGRMLGSLSSNKNYIGQDISPIHINESIDIIEFLKQYYPNIDENILLTVGDSSIAVDNYDCLFTCPPYGDKEQWLGVIPDTRTCDDWIDICLNNYKCNKYLFVVDNTKKYKDKIVEVIENRSHFGSNNEYVILI